MKESDLQCLGFQFAQDYLHDDFITKVYQKGILIVSLTYEAKGGNTGKLIDTSLSIEEVNGKPTTLPEIKVLTAILGNYID